MKVLFVLDTLEVGGAERSLLEMIPNFTKVEALVLHIYKGDTLKASYETAGIRVISLNLVGPYNFQKAIMLVREIIVNEKPDIIHSVLLRSSLICRWIHYWDGIKHIGSFVNDSYVRERYKVLSFLNRTKLKVFQYLDRFTASWCNHYVAITKTIKQSNAMYLRVPLDKISVIYRGRNPDNYTNINETLQQDSFVFINVARLIIRKGQSDLIHAFAKVVNKFPDCKLWLVGDGPSRFKYEDLISELKLNKSVFLKGYRDDIPELITSSHCFVMPSHFEGLGGSLIEAMFASRPIIASNIPVLAENINEGVNGILFEQGNIDQLTSCMEWMYLNRNKAQEMGKRGREIAKNKFDVRVIAKQYEALYEKLFLQ